MEPVQEDRDGLLVQLLYGQLQSMGWLPDEATPIHRLRDATPLRDTHGRWLEESLRILTRAGRVAFDGDTCRALAGRADLDAAWRAWDGHVRASRHDDAARHALALVDATLRALPEILSGRRLATDVVFPDGSMALVEHVYRDNPVSDHFNEALADCVETYLDARLRDAPGAAVRILEIGAGTGGTSVSVFRRLRRFAGQVAEYCYTDLSKAFLFHAEQAYGPAHPYLAYRTLDIGEPLAAQGIALARYDLAIATNVLHATPDVRRSVRNAKAALRPDGLLLLNELSDKRLYSHLTFGLLDGWWLYEDPALRIEGSPVLAPDTWRFVLEQEGFRAVRFPARDAQALGQQIVVAASDGVIRQARAAAPAARAAGRPAAEPVVRVPTPAACAPSAQAGTTQTPDALRDIVAASVGVVLRIDAAEIDRDQPFSDYGLDSILGVTLVRRLNEQLEIHLNSTSVFDYCTVNALARHAHALRGTPARDAAASVVPRPAQAQGGGLALEEIRAVVLDCLSTVLRVRADDIDIDEPFSDYGLDSILGVNFVRLLNERLAAGLSTTSIFDYSSVRGIAAHLASLRTTDSAPARVPPETADHAVGPERTGAAPGREPIAVIGMSGRYAKSRNLDALWQHLENGANLVEDVTRWDLSRHLEGSANCERGSFLDTIDEFDPLFFNISGIEATYMDPQQRIFLEEAWTALEDAGYAGASMAGRRCGVYVGCGDVDYTSLLPDAPPAHAMWGTATSIIPARIAYYLNLQGPAIAIDTACSSSLVATHLACQALWNGETELALAGGVFLMCTPNVYKIANRAAMLSPTGQCFTFDDRADGFVPGEGVGVVVLKRLSDALADGDTIHGVIRGSGINQDGTTNGITAPSALSQERLERQVYDTFGIDPEGIQLVEAHGTGTRLGDPIEYHALTQAFRAYTDKRAYCAIGSIKTNLGHTTAAAGVTGLLKILLALRHRKIPASLNYASGNTHIEFADSPFFVNTSLRPWQVGAGEKRRAALSSFGFSGTNAHLVVEEAPAVEIVPAERPGYLIVLSAKSDEQLRALVGSMRDDCAARAGLHGANLSFTLLLGRQHFSRRWACVARSIEEFTALATAWLEHGRSSRVYAGRVNEKHPPEQPALQRYGNQCLAQCRDAATPERYLEELHAVADLYVQGYALDYALLFAGERHQRLSLPTYPFARERYWVPASAAQPTVARAGLHPLVQRNTSDFSVQRYSARFNGAEFFLADHVVRGRNMLPAVAYLEMAREAACLADGAHAGPVRLSHVVWARPIVVNDAPVDVHVELVPQDDGGIVYRIGGDADGDAQVHGEGRVLLGDAGSIAGDTLDLRSLRQACVATLPAEQCYALYRRMGVDYGRAHQAIECLHAGDRQVLGRLVLPESVAGTREQYVLHPSVLDGALQSVAGLLREEWEATGRSSLPFAVDQVDVLAGCVERMWVWARFSAGSGPQARVRKFDLDVCDDEGRVCVRLRGFTTRVMEEAIESTPPVAETETLLLHPVWEAARADAHAPAYSEHLVLLAGGQT
ncbi:beta-ketoacyl synthase N-terminal-like domain-containing protein, partial [Burkholderia ubonensis]|uniref:beta-ketoacyl synthase N-terminal-like domain-containing protein n=1 Tax=Burkholderia ubonensis TaxID=101571 RepID=UPI00117859F2